MQYERYDQYKLLTLNEIINQELNRENPISITTICKNFIEKHALPYDVKKLTALMNYRRNKNNEKKPKKESFRKTYGDILYEEIINGNKLLSIKKRCANFEQVMQTGYSI